MAMFNRSAGKVRYMLLASACIGALTAAPQAMAQDSGTGVPVGASGFMAPVAPQPSGGGHVDPVAPEAQVAGPADVAVAAPDPQILIANPGTPTTARDPVNINGIGQMIVNSGGGSVGLCTGTLINPRTVLFAAHCVNSRAATAYGTGGTQIGFGFETNLRANAPGQPDELINWLLGGSTGPGQGRTNIAQAFYNVNQVRYNPLSLEPEAVGFLYGDVAIASLDTPAANIPTWAILFSPLPTPGTIKAAGTGYNVGIAGYGGNGTGTSGTLPIDFRRRAAENILGALTDLRTFETFLFGTSNSPTQNLYFIDFDDPRRGLTGASPFDFNAFRDNARGAGTATPTEGTTAGGDSGGPLILQTFSRQLVIGVLSGGYTRFFGAQPANGFGTVSFYQPLYLYWDWIAANNPYRYASTVAGDGQWTDPARWVTTLDPAYQILVGGQPVNGIPNDPGLQKDGTGGGFGQTCFQTTTSSDCLDIATGAVISTASPIGTATDNSARAVVTSEQRNGDLGRGFNSVELAARAEQGGLALPAATLANGLPGATNFVPNNVDPVRATGAIGRYYDVTLTAAGTTTLSGAAVTIDRLSIGTANARLIVANGASLTTLINTTQFAGMNIVDGTLTSVGDYSLLGGALMGSGRINAPFLTSVLGQIAPGTQTTIGTLTIGGNVVLASGSGLFINLGTGGISDRLAAVANGTSAGAINLGGAVNFSAASGYRPTNGDRFTFITAAGGVTGTFGPQAALSAILTPRLTYGANAVSLEIIAGNYRDVIAAGAPIQSAYAQLLDQNRPRSAAFSSLYGELDLLAQAALRSNLDALAPNNVPIQMDIGTASTELLSSFIRDRIARVSSGDLGGSVATYGRPLQLASLALNMTQDGGEVRSDAGSPMRVDDAALNEDVSIFLAGGYIDGRGSALPFGGAGRSDFDGFYLTGGGEVTLGEGGFLGFAMGYSDIDGTARNVLTTASGRVIQGTLYAATEVGEAASIDLQVGAGQFSTTSTRIVPVGAAVQTLGARDDALAISAEAGLSYRLGSDAFALTPRVAVRYGSIDFTPTAERGGSAALQYDLGNLQSLQGRIGVTAAARRGAVRPFANVTFVNEFEGRAAAFGGNFRGGIGADALFALPSTDSNWFEVSGGLSAGSETFNASIAGETQIGRDDIRTYSVRGTVLFRF